MTELEEMERRAMAAEAGRDALLLALDELSSVIGRIGQMANAWERRFPEQVSTAAVVGSLRDVIGRNAPGDGVLDKIRDDERARVAKEFRNRADQYEQGKDAPGLVLGQIWDGTTRAMTLRHHADWIEGKADAP